MSSPAGPADLARRAASSAGRWPACWRSLVAGIWVVPGMLDWNRYRDSIAALVAAGIGRPVRIGGDVTLHLLPQPILTASGDRGGRRRATALALAAQRAAAAGGARAAARRPGRCARADAAGRRSAPALAAAAGALTRRPPAWLTGLQARVEESRLQVGSLVLSDIDASLATDPDTGTLSAAGVGDDVRRAPGASRRGWPGPAATARPRSTSASTARASCATPAARSPARSAADGALSGRVAGRGPDLSQVMPAPAVPWRGDGRLSAAAGLAVADELALEIGGSPARGAVALRVQPEARLDLAIAAGRLDLDAWIPVLMRSAQPGMQPGLPTGIDLSAEAATLAGGTLRRLRGAFDLDADGVAVRDATALLPGDAQLRAARAGCRGRARGHAVRGRGAADAPDLRSTLRWLEPFAPAVLGALPAGALRTADLTAKVALDPAQASLSDLQGHAGRRAARRAGWRLRIGPRIGSQRRPRRSTGCRSTPGCPTRPPRRPGRRLCRADPGARARRRSTRTSSCRSARPPGAGRSSAPLSIDAQSEAGRLTLRRLEATAFGIRLTASGTLGEGGRVSEGRLELSTQDVSPLRGAAAAWAGGAPALLRGPGEPAAAAVRAAGRAGRAGHAGSGRPAGRGAPR